MSSVLTDRQLREIEYHRGHAALHADILARPLTYDICEGTRWWNNGWVMYGVLRRIGMAGKRVLVVGCGFGTDAVRIARMGAEVHAFDLSPESLAIARQLADQEDQAVAFDEMPAERLTYPPGYFDVIVARDILHHVDIPLAMSELRRVAKPGATFVINEIYSHSWTDRVRHARLVERVLYPTVQRILYGNRVYITKDERKLTERDIALIRQSLTVRRRRYFNLLVMRFIPDRFKRVSQADQLLLRCMGAFGAIVAGRIMLEACLGS